MSIIMILLKIGYSYLVKISPLMASKVIYFWGFGRYPNLKNPVTFNEKLMWLKLNEDYSLKTLCADKYSVRKYLQQLGYSDLLVDLYKVYENVEEIDFHELPNSFVMKCTHGSGFNIICPDKDKIDEKQIMLQLKKWMKTDYSLKSCEPHYRNIKPRVIIEKFLKQSDNKESLDYKVHCFHGEPKMIEIIIDDGTLRKKEILLNCDWEVLPYNEDSANYLGTIEKPHKLNEMLEVSKDLSEVFTYVRVDYYYSNNKIYFGELTFTPAACIDKDFINNADYLVGELLDLSDLTKAIGVQDLATLKTKRVSKKTVRNLVRENN